MTSQAGRYRVVTVSPDTPLLASTRSLGDTQRKTVGLLRSAAWVDYAARGQIAAVPDPALPDTPLAYVAFRTPRDEVVIAHLVVAPEARGRGLARTLVEHLSSVHAQRRGVALWCRRDWPAHGMWPVLGFVPRGERPGRGRDGKPLTRWWLDHGHQDLMSWQGAPPVWCP